MRRKLFKPDAAGTRSGGRPSKTTVSSGTKKKPSAKPCTTSGATKTQKLASAVKRARMKYETANTANENVASRRASMREIQRPTSGDTSTAATPLGAATSP